MNTTSREWWLLDERQPVPLAELARMCGMSAPELAELVEYGALEPSASDAADTWFTADYVHPLREAARMRALFDLDLFSAGLLAGYLHRIELLERQVRALQGQVPGHGHPSREGPATWREPHA